MKNLLLFTLFVLPFTLLQAQEAPSGYGLIEGGTFMMGSPTSESGRYDNERQHEVTVSSFYMKETEVTQAEYEAVMGGNPSSFEGDNRPVEQVIWYDAVEYCNALSLVEGLAPVYTINGTNVTANWNANGYRLPMEAEWEYACRAGTETPFHNGSRLDSGMANFNGNYPYGGASKGVYRERTTDVGSFSPNGWGLYDMRGNVWEWCWDRYGEYSPGSQTDPRGSNSGSYRIKRGGGWDCNAQSCRAAYRGRYNPSARGGVGVSAHFRRSFDVHGWGTSGL